MNLDVTGRAISILRVLIVRRTSRLNGAHTVVYAVACQTKLVDGAVFQQSRIRGAVRNVTRRTALCLDGSVFKNEWPLFVGVAFYASGIGAGRQPGLFQLKTTMRIMTVATFHRAF